MCTNNVTTSAIAVAYVHYYCSNVCHSQYVATKYSLVMSLLRICYVHLCVVGINYFVYVIILSVPHNCV